MSRRLLLALCAAVPGIVLAAAGLWGAFTHPGGALVWPPDRVTLPEAVAAGSYAEVAWQIERGTDPNPPAEVRAGLLGPGPARLTPLQAAVRGRNPLMVRILLEHGAVVGPSGLAVLRCMNEEEPSDDVRALLDALGPPGGAACDAVEIPR